MMKIKFNSLSIKTVFLLIATSSIFMFVGYSMAKNAISKNYKEATLEKIDIVLNSISPQISLNLSYGFLDAINEINKEQLHNKHILLIKLTSPSIEKPFIYKQNDDITMDTSNFKSTKNLVDPSTSNVIGNLTLLYSSESYEKQMKEFYHFSLFSGIIFILSLLLISLFLLRSLRPLSKLAHTMSQFDPYKPKKFNINTVSKDEVGSIVNSANVMVENLISYIEHSSSLTKELSKQEQHLKEAQRISSIGSWEYNISQNLLILSDEIYRLLGINKKMPISWDKFLSFVAKEDHDHVIQILSSAIRNGSRFNLKYKLHLLNNKVIYIKTKGKVRKKASGDTKLTAVSIDITKDMKNKQIIERLAYYDSLTNLPNRTLFKDRVHTAIANAKRNKTKIAIMFLDLDNFKIVNDTLGHSMGDKLLIYIAKLLESLLRENDTISRVGGDEFTILLTGITKEGEAAHVASKILNALEGEHFIDDHKLKVTTSIGIALYPDSAQDIDNLIRNADTAMYEAKKADKNTFKTYNEKMHAKIHKFIQVEHDLRKSIDIKGAFEIYYQGKINSRTKSISGCEALVRWNHPEKGLIYPDEFITVAEETSLILPIGNIIIEEAIKGLSEFSESGFTKLKVAINLSAKQFSDNTLITTIEDTIDKYNVNPAQLEFEITESLSMQNIAKTLEVLYQLKTIGVSIAIDDFGTGYSSLSYLKQFPINTLKIDKSFVLDMAFDKDDENIVNTIINMAHTLNFTTVAEGVETIEHVNLLTQMDCDELQGYHYSRPVPKHEFIDFLKSYNAN